MTEQHDTSKTRLAGKDCYTAVAEEAEAIRKRVFNRFGYITLDLCFSPSLSILTFPGVCDVFIPSRDVKSAYISEQYKPITSIMDEEEFLRVVRGDTVSVIE